MEDLIQIVGLLLFFLVSVVLQGRNQRARKQRMLQMRPQRLPAKTAETSSEPAASPALTPQEIVRKLQEEVGLIQEPDSTPAPVAAVPPPPPPVAPPDELSRGQQSADTEDRRLQTHRVKAKQQRTQTHRVKAKQQRTQTHRVQAKQQQAPHTHRTGGRSANLSVENVDTRRHPLAARLHQTEELRTAIILREVLGPPRCAIGWDE